MARVAGPESVGQWPGPLLVTPKWSPASDVIRRQIQSDDDNNLTSFDLEHYNDDLELIIAAEFYQPIRLLDSSSNPIRGC